MKRSLGIILAFLLVINVASALFVTSIVKPTITNTFNETLNPSTLVPNLTYFSDPSILIGLSTDTSDNRTFKWTPFNALDNGYYFFKSIAVDIVGNNQSYTDIIFVNATEFKLKWSEPKLGIFTSSSGGLGTLSSNLFGTCRYAFTAKPSSWVQLSNTGNLTHQQTFSPIFFPAPQPIFFNCTDSFGRVKIIQLYLGYDSTPPNILEASANPSTVSRPTETELKIRSDDAVACTADGQPFDSNDENVFGDYKTTVTKKITYPAQAQTYTHNIVCKNRAQLSTSTTIAVEVNPAAGLVINVIQPPQYTPNTTVKFQITTNQLANCAYGPTSAAELNMSSAENESFTHTATASLSTGAHTYFFNCQSETDSNQAQHTFIIDTTPPNNLSLNFSPICKSSEMTLGFKATDNESGIDSFNYMISSSNQTLVNWTTTTNNDVTVSGLNLTNGKSYTASFKAINKAKISSAPLTLSQNFNPNQTACLEKNPPTIIVKENATQYGVEVTLNCTDESGCDSTYFVGIAATAERCNATTILTAPYKRTISQTSYLCWDIADRVGNHAKSSKKITVAFLAKTCGNGVKDGDESDIDCGGSCNPCVVGAFCGASKDCDSNWCVQGTCKASSCTDGQQNGLESDVDCGGSCSKCKLSANCTTNPDCASSYCFKSRCTEAKCDDGVLNGDESDIDCGGSCNKCPDSKGCNSDSDCSSGTCESSICTTLTEDQRWEKFARQNNIDPADRSGDADKDGLSNFDEFKYGTNPNVKDSDADGYSDGYEVKAGTNPSVATSYPSIGIFNALFLFLGAIGLITWVLLAYVFKKENKSSLYFGIIGGAAIVFGLLGYVFVSINIYIPAFIPGILLIPLLGGLGYVGYKIYPTIVKPAPKAPVQGRAQISAPARPAEAERRPLTAEDIKARKVMEEMIKKQKEAKEEQRRSLFNIFGAPKEKAEAPKPILKTELKEIKAPPPKPAEFIPEARTPDEFEKLSKIVDSKAEFGRLGKLLEAGEKRRPSEFERLEKVGAGAKGRLEELADRAKKKGRRK